MCKVKGYYQTGVVREQNFGGSKWIISHNEYPFTQYPVSCVGPIYVIKRYSKVIFFIIHNVFFFCRDVVDFIYKEAEKRNPYRIEDVYYTGILPAISQKSILLADIKDLLDLGPRWKFPDNLITKLTTLGNPTLKKPKFIKAWSMLLDYYIFKNSTFTLAQTFIK